MEQINQVIRREWSVRLVNASILGPQAKKLKNEPQVKGKPVPVTGKNGVKGKKVEDDDEDDDDEDDDDDDEDKVSRSCSMMFFTFIV